MEDRLNINIEPKNRVDWFDSIIENYQVSIIRFFYRVSADMDLAVRLAQDTFIQAYHEISTTQNNIEIKHRLYFIASHLVDDYFTPQKSLFLRRRVNNNIPKLLNPVVITNEIPDRAEVQIALLALPVINRACAVLHFVEGFGYRTVAEITGLSEIAVRDNIYTVKRSLRSDSNMNSACSDFGALLSAYTDREITAEERNQIEAHLPKCARCHKTLEDYKIARDRLASLWLTPPLPDVKNATIARLKELKMPTSKKQAMKPRTKLVYLSTLTLFVILVLPLILTADSRFDPIAFLEKVHQNTNKVTSYSMDILSIEKLDYLSTSTFQYELELQYARADLYHIKIVTTYGTSTNLNGEITAVNENIYSNSLSAASISPQSTISRIPTDLYDNQFPSYISGIEKLADEKIGGIDCFHFKCTINKVKYIEATLTQMGVQLEVNTGTSIMTGGNSVTITITGGNSGAFTLPSGGIAMSGILNNLEDEVISLDLWIDKYNHLVVQEKKKIEIQNQNKYAASVITTITKFSYPTQQMVIETPITNEGALLPNWQLYKNQNGTYIRAK